MLRTRTSSIPELLLTLDRDGAVALHRQLERGLQDAIRTRRLEPGAPLPSTRALATELGLSRGVVVEAYEQLTAEGYLESRPGGKTRVGRRPDGGAGAEGRVAETDGRAAAADGLAAPPDRWVTGALDEGAAAIPNAITERARFDFGYGWPDVSQFPRQAWLRSLRRVLNEAPSERLSYIDARGAPELREALASYLNRVRGTSASADRMVITNGFAQGQRLAFQIVGAMARDADGPRRRSRAIRIAQEEPGQDDTRRAAEALGIELVPIPVDEDGIDVERLASVDASLCVVTPAHHFPTGAVMSPERRAALVRWAREREAFVLEDDYDAEYRYDREPIGAIQGLAPERVIYGGSASKTLAPGLRLGWLILPPPLVEPFATTRYRSDRGSPSIEQLAFADFLSRGEFDRHLRRMRPIYRSRRDALLRALARRLPEVRPTGASAGLHLLAWLPDGVDEAAVVARAAALDVGVDGLAQYRIAAAPGRDAPRGGLILGYGRITEREIGEGIERLASAVKQTLG